MDEPTSELDPVGKREIFSVVETLRDEYGITIILVEHEAEQIARFADRVVMMTDGIITYDASPRTFFTKVLEEKTRRIRCPQVSELANLLQGSGTWRWEIPIRLKECVGHVREMLSGASYKQQQMDVETNSPQKLEHIIEVRDLSFKYPSGVEALHGINLDISKSEIVAIIGQNGSGKTTLVKHFNGLLRPTTGSVKLLGEETSGQKVPELSRIVRLRIPKSRPSDFL